MSLSILYNNQHYIYIHVRQGTCGLIYTRSGKEATRQ
jgi:hypothetical protein